MDIFCQKPLPKSCISNINVVSENILSESYAWSDCQNPLYSQSDPSESHHNPMFGQSYPCLNPLYSQTPVRISCMVNQTYQNPIIGQSDLSESHRWSVRPIRVTCMASYNPVRIPCSQWDLSDHSESPVWSLIPIRTPGFACGTPLVLHIERVPNWECGI